VRKEAALLVPVALLLIAGAEPERADVVAVRAAGSPGAYRFSVTIRSPDRDCTRYASWWEVLDEDGALLYRRILAHSHAQEQPFARAGGPVPVQPEQTVVVRAHLHPDGYGGALFRGSVADGFARWQAAPEGFAPGLATAAPQPQRCLY
jgi:hypothetical protein